MDVLTSTKGQRDLPRYFPQVFEVASKMQHGRLDMVLPDGRLIHTGVRTAKGVVGFM